MAVCHLKNFIEILFILLNNISVLYSLSEIIQIIGGGFSWCILYLRFFFLFGEHANKPDCYQIINI